MTIKTILVCVSSAEASRSALQAACLLAQRFDAHIEALHVRADPRSLVLAQPLIEPANVVVFPHNYQSGQAPV